MYCHAEMDSRVGVLARKRIKFEPGIAVAKAGQLEVIGRYRRASKSAAS